MNGNKMPTYVHQKWRQLFARYCFTVVHWNYRYLVKYSTFTQYKNLVINQQYQHQSQLPEKNVSKTVVTFAAINFKQGIVKHTNNSPVGGTLKLLLDLLGMTI